MQSLLTTFGIAASRWGILVNVAPLKRAVCLTALVGAFGLAHLTFGEDNEPARKPDGAAAPAATPASAPAASKTAQAAPARREQNRPPAADDHVRHHGALGVLLGASGEGVSVVGVMPDSPAERAGLRPGDEIRYVEDQRIRTTQELTDEIGKYEPGTEVDLLIRRNGQRQVVRAALATPESAFAGRDRAPRRDAGHPPVPPRHGEPQAGRGGPPPGPPPRERQRQQTEMRIRDLQMRISHLQREIDDLRYSHRVNNSVDSRSWWDRQHHGEADDDPMLFQ